MALDRLAAARRFVVAASAVWIGAAAFFVQASPEADRSRGALLYETHCLACHSVQIHWRDHGQVKDWESLNREVDRWQSSESLRWSTEDIDAVSRYLDDTHYKLPSKLRQPRPNRG